MSVPDNLSLLRAGKLAGATRLDLSSCNLTELPREVFDLADTLEILDLGRNQLTDLPDDLPRLKRLRVLFCTNNGFRHAPAVTGQCESLEMLAFKSCQVEEIDAESFPPGLRWLILTDNRIRQIPGTLGRCVALQKLMLSGNRLSTLPEGMSGCINLEMLRIAANEFTALPPWLLELPRLAWLAFSGNPCTALTPAENGLPAIDWSGLTLQHQLGEGASGVISFALWHRPGKEDIPVAVKVFKAAITSDGLPESEMAAGLAAGGHAHLIPVLGQIANHPDKAAQAMAMSLIDPAFTTLAGPPSLQSCTRDVYAESLSLEAAAALKLAAGVADAAAHLHSRGFTHGDLYAHNIQWQPSGECLLGDFGAAARYAALDVPARAAVERFEVRAWGVLVEELLARVTTPEAASLDSLRALAQRCCTPVVTDRPTFAEIVAAL